MRGRYAPLPSPPSTRSPSQSLLHDDTRPWLAPRHPLSASFDADELHVRIIEEGAEDADGIRAAPDARDHDVREPPERRKRLLARLAADHRLEVAHHRRVRVRADG